MLADIQWTERQLAYISSQMGGWIATATVVRETEKKSLRARLRDKAARGAMPCPANVNLPGSVIVPQRPRSDAGTDLQLTELFRGKRFRAKRTELRENVREILRSLDEATGGHVAERIDEKTSPYREEALAIVLAMTPDIVEEFMANAAPILGIITDIAGVGLSLWDAAVKEAGRRRVHRAVHRLDNTNAKTVGAAFGVCSGHAQPEAARRRRRRGGGAREDPRIDPGFRTDLRSSVGRLSGDLPPRGGRGKRHHAAPGARRDEPAHPKRRLPLESRQLSAARGLRCRLHG